MRDFRQTHVVLDKIVNRLNSLTHRDYEKFDRSVQEVDDTTHDIMRYRTSAIAFKFGFSANGFPNGFNPFGFSDSRPICVTTVCISGKRSVKVAFRQAEETTTITFVVTENYIIEQVYLFIDEDKKVLPLGNDVRISKDRFPNLFLDEEEILCETLAGNRILLGVPKLISQLYHLVEFTLLLLLRLEERVANEQ